MRTIQLCPALHIAPQNTQLQPERGVLRLKPAVRLERRNQKGRHKTDQRDHAVRIADSPISSTRMRCSAHTQVSVPRSSSLKYFRLPEHVLVCWTGMHGSRCALAKKPGLADLELRGRSDALPASPGRDSYPVFIIALRKYHALAAKSVAPMASRYKNSGQTISTPAPR